MLFTPGVYQLDKALKVKHAGTVVLGLGFPTLVPTGGDATMTVGDVTGVKLAGLMFDAGPVSSPVLLEVGKKNAHKSDAGDPTTLSDVFFRIGGATPGKAATSLVVNSDDVILDDIWAWRADHGNGVGWTANTADTGVIVNGDNVTAYGLFVEHYQRYETIWNGQNGRVVFYQNEMPYDPPSQAAWTEAPGVPGWAAFKIADSVTSFRGFGMGSYSFFNQGIDIFAANAFEVPATLPAGEPQRPAHDLPGSERREGRHPQRHQRHRRVVDDRQSGCPGHGGELSLIARSATGAGLGGRNPRCLSMDEIAVRSRTSWDPRSSTTGSGRDASSSTNRRCIALARRAEARVPSSTHGKSSAVRNVRS